LQGEVLLLRCNIYKPDVANGQPTSARLLTAPAKGITKVRDVVRDHNANYSIFGKLGWSPVGSRQIAC
jgi:hypothetical protein